jgi:hypothetical protein
VCEPPPPPPPGGGGGRGAPVWGGGKGAPPPGRGMRHLALSSGVSTGRCHSVGRCGEPGLGLLQAGPEA